MDSATLNYFLIFKSFFMKNLFITMSCFAAILLTSSCTADSPVETKTENQIAPTKIIDPGTAVAEDGITDPIPPKK